MDTLTAFISSVIASIQRVFFMQSDGICHILGYFYAKFVCLLLALVQQVDLSTNITIKGVTLSMSGTWPCMLSLSSLYRLFSGVVTAGSSSARSTGLTGSLIFSHSIFMYVVS
jgi:hypothetical protein